MIGRLTFIRSETTIANLEKYAATGLEGIPDSDITEIKSYPNTFSDEIMVEINLKSESEISVEVLNQLGQKVKT